MTELGQAPAAETTSPEPAGELRPGSHDSQAQYPRAVTAADTDPGYYDGDIQAALAADTTPTRQQAARDATAHDHQAGDGTMGVSPDAPDSGGDSDIEAILHENDNLPEPRTRQQAARDDVPGSDTATDKDSVAGTDQQPRSGSDPLTSSVTETTATTADSPARAPDDSSPTGRPDPDAKTLILHDRSGHDVPIAVVLANPGDRTLGDTTPTGIGRKPTGEQLTKMENEEASKPEKLRRKFLEGIDDINDAARDNASLGHDLLTRHQPPAGHVVTEVPHPLSDAPHEGGLAPDITSAGLVAGILLVEATRLSREPIHRIAEAAKGHWPWR